MERYVAIANEIAQRHVSTGYGEATDEVFIQSLAEDIEAAIAAKAEPLRCALELAEAEVERLRAGYQKILNTHDQCPQAQWIVELAHDSLGKKR